MNPLVDLQTGWVPPAQAQLGGVGLMGQMGGQKGPADSQGVPLSLYRPFDPTTGLALNQPANYAPGQAPGHLGMPSGFMGNVLQQPSQAGLMGGVPSLQGVQPGDWSSVAYNMAGRPIQGPYPTAPGLPMPAGVTNGSQSSGGSPIGGTALGILGALAKNPSLLKSAYNGISSLFGGSAIPASVAAEGNAAATAANAATSAYAANGIGDISELPSVQSAVDAGAAGDTAAPAVSGGLLGSSAPAAGGAAIAGGAGTVGSTASALGAGAPGVFASGSADAVGGGAAAASGGAGSGLASAAGPIGIAAAAYMAAMALGDAWTAKNTQGNAAMKAWMNATGSKFVPNPGLGGGTGVGRNQGAANTFGTTNAQLAASSNPGTYYDANGNVMTPKQVAAAITAWGKANGFNTGDYNYTGGG